MATLMQLSETASEASEDDSVFDSDLETSDGEEFHGIPTWQTSANIAKNIIGEGILSLPAGLAAGTGIFSGVLITLSFYVVMVYTFWTLGRVCEVTAEKSHRGMGNVVTEGLCFGNLMAATNLVKTLFTCTAYALVIGRNAEDVLAPLNSDSWFSSRRGSWVTILLCVLLPLCLLRDMGKLAWTSFLGLLCETGVVIFMLWRLLDGSYQPGGEYYASQRPGTQASWGETGEVAMWTVSPATLTLISSMSTAFLAHYNAPKFYHQLCHRSSRQFFIASASSFTCALALFLTCMVVGYLTFGTDCAGNILHNYSDRDPAAAASRAAMLLAVTCGFPIAFTGLRDAALSLCACSSRRRVWVPVTLCLLTLIGALGWSLDDLGALNRIGGAILGSLITMVYPGLLLTWAYPMTLLQKVPLFWRVEGKVVGRVVTATGFLLLVFGTAVVVKNTIA
ncbi:SLC38A8 [Symbiodinium pilosum]|uniref:SLC38A8 protein n=1 Tax=Symbiodinium pilosum TaxID=2952 RepID=A0A812KAY7_SYMPI|nr:SLC38A8 [Symbiodinium pilosum]